MIAGWLWLCTALGADLVIRGDVVHPVSGPPIARGVVVVTDGRITAVGTDDTVEVPEGARELSGAVVTPGLIDGLGVTGLSGALNRPADQDHAEHWDPVTPQLAAADAYDPWETLVGWVREHGVTTVQSGPSPGAPVAGRTVVARTLGGALDDVALVADGAMIFTLGEAPKGPFAGQGAQTRMGSAALIRQALAGARDYGQRRRLPLADRPPVDLGQEALVDVLERRRRAIVVAHRADDLLTALRLGEEFDLDLVLAGASEAYLVREAIAAAGVSVWVGPVMTRHWRGGERRHASLENAALLVDAGVRVGFASGYEGYVPKVRVVLWEAALAAANGLGAERTLRALTLDAATMLGLDDRLGSLEVGKEADLVVFDGDPFEYTSHACGVVVAGAVVSESCR